MKALVIAACVVLLFCATGLAAPTYFGPSGLANVPGPAAMGAGQYNLFYNLISGDTDVGFYGGNIGLGEKMPIEVGATVVKPKGASSETVVNAKVWYVMSGKQPFDVAVGVIDAFDAVDQVIYLAAGKALNAKSAGKGGIPAIYGIVGLGSSNSLLDGLFAGVTATLPSKLNVHLEYDSEDLNLGVNYPISESLNFRADLVSDDTGLGISYSLPTKY